MDLPMSAVLSRSALPLPTANFETCRECGANWRPGHQCPLKTTRAADDRCPVCEYWTCRCTTSRRLVAAGIVRRAGGRTLRITATPAGVTGSIRPAGAR